MKGKDKVTGKAGDLEEKWMRFSMDRVTGS